MALDTYACVNTRLPCPRLGIGVELEESDQVRPCVECGQPMLNLTDLPTEFTPEVIEIEEERVVVGQASGPPYAGHTLLLGDHDAIPPPRQRRRASSPATPPVPAPPLERVYGGETLTGEPLSDNLHLQQLRKDLRRLGYWGPRARGSPNPEVFDFHFVGSIMALKADLKFRYGVSDVPYATPSRPEGLEKLAGSQAFSEGSVFSALFSSWKKLLPLKSPLEGPEAQIRRRRLQQLQGPGSGRAGALGALRAVERRNRRGEVTVVRPSLADKFREISSTEIGAASPTFTSPLQAKADRSALGFTDGLIRAAGERQAELGAVRAGLDDILREATGTNRSGEPVPWAHAEEFKTLTLDLMQAVEAWKVWFTAQLERARPYLAELTLLGSVDNSAQTNATPVPTAMRIQQMLAGAVPGVTEPIFRVPRGEELVAVDESGRRDIVVALLSGSGRTRTVTPNPEAAPLVSSLCREAGETLRVPDPILVSYVGHESRGRHTEGAGGGVLYGVDWDNDRPAQVNKIHRHDFDPFRGRPGNHWAFSRGWGLGALTPTKVGTRGGARRSVFGVSGASSQIPFVRGLPESADPIPDIIRSSRENLAQTVRLMRNNFKTTERATSEEGSFPAGATTLLAGGRGRQCTFFSPGTRTPSFDCPSCLRRFELGRDVLLQADTLYLSEAAFRGLPEFTELKTALGREPTPEEMTRARREFPCSWLRVLTNMVGGSPATNQTQSNFSKHYATITGRLNLSPEEGDDEAESGDTPGSGDD